MGVESVGGGGAEVTRPPVDKSSVSPEIGIFQ